MPSSVLKKFMNSNPKVIAKKIHKNQFFLTRQALESKKNKVPEIPTAGTPYATENGLARREIQIVTITNCLGVI